MGKETIEGQVFEWVAELVIETALPLVLTQDPRKANKPNHQFIPDSARLKVYADEVTILGKLSMRNVEIFARLLRTRADGDVQPAISVDGPAWPKKDANPRALNKGETPERSTKVKVPKGKKGEPGFNEQAAAAHLPKERKEPGENGWSAPQHPDEMNGEPGRNGKEGNRAGDIFIVCEQTDFSAPLSLSAVGGPGGKGQDGQPGADGGDGGKGFDADPDVQPVTYKHSTAGGNGGQGGNGGDGGQGGKGGDGGAIVFRSISTSPSVTTVCEGGTSGPPGEGGARGEGGLRGEGGKSGVFRIRGFASTDIPASPPGEHGQPGNVGNRGPAALLSNAGSAKVDTGQVNIEKLAELASVSQLQMLFERIRAVYLVTEPQPYDLLLQSVIRSKDIVEKGRNLVVAAAVGSRLHIRAFDANGNKVVDKPESELMGGERLDALKQRLQALGLRFEPLDLTPRGVLLAGGWVTATAPEPAGGWRGALLNTLNDHANTTGQSSYYAQLDDRNLARMVAAAAFLLKAAVCDKRTLQRKLANQQKQLLIEAIQNSSGRSYDELQGLPVEMLVEIGAESTDAFRRDLRISRIKGLSEEDERKVKQKIIEDVACVLGSEPDPLDWVRLGQRLHWVNQISFKIPETNPQKPLAELVNQSAWNAYLNYDNRLDYFGKRPEFAPIVSLSTYLTFLENSLKTLEAIELKAIPYFNSLREEKDAVNDLRAAIQMTDRSLGLLNSRIGGITTELYGQNGVWNKIGALDSKLKSKKNGLKTKLDRLATQIDTAFGLSVDTFFNCLSQLSFTNVHEPVSALAMGVSQIGTMGREARTKVLNKHGEPLSKNWVLEQIEVIREEADLKSEFKHRADGSLSHQDSDRLLVQLDKFRELCKQFYGSLDDAREVRQELDEYIEAITKRNRHIDYYNLLAGDLMLLDAEVERQKLQKTAVDGALALNESPGLPAMATFVSGLYEQAKAICISDLYHAHRAYSLWALEPFSDFYAKIGRSPGAITHLHLAQKKTDLEADLLKALGKNYRTPKHFPVRSDAVETMGRVVVLTKGLHPDFFADLAYSGQAEFELEPPTQDSLGTDNDPFRATNTAWCGSERPSPGVYFNPFAGMADVRLTKVRVWLAGEENKLNHNVILTHLGEEQFRRRDDTPFPMRLDPPEEEDQDRREARYILHEPVPIPYNYNAEGISYDAKNRTFTPGNLFGRNVGSEDGDLRFPKGGISDLPAAGEYAPIGPFGKWRLEVPRLQNLDLDLSKLNAVVIDFHGFHQTFADKRP
jgi:hypothetical protein